MRGPVKQNPQGYITYLIERIVYELMSESRSWFHIVVDFVAEDLS